MTAPKPVTLARAVDEYLATLATESTKRTYGAALSQMRKRFGDDTALADLTLQDVAGWLQEQWGGASSGTFNVRLRAVKSAAAWWAEQGWIPAGLTATVKPRKSRAVLAAEVLSPDEVRALMDRAAGSSAPSRQSPTGIRNKALIMLLYRSGLRIGEILSIRPGDIDHEARSIRVLRTKAGQPSTRYYHPTAEASLQQWLERRRSLGLNGRQPVFSTLQGAPLSQEYVRAMLKASAEEAGIEKRVHPHGLRHTFAGELVRSGADYETISRLLGHESVATTAKYLKGLTNAEAGAALGSLDMPDVGEGGQQAYPPEMFRSEAEEKSVEEQLAALRRELAELRKCKGEK